MDEESEKSENVEIPEAETSAEAEDNGRSVSSDLIRGHINTIILRALFEGDKYGYEIIADIEEKSHGQYSLKQPSLYSALKRLEKDGCVTSYWGGSVSGGRRKYFSLTDLGKEISQRNQSEWEYSRTIIDSLISDKDFDFSNPAPNNVDMRLLRDTTSRVPRESVGDDEEGMLRFGSMPADDGTLAERESKLAAQEAALREKIEEMRKEQEWRENELAAREESLKSERERLLKEVSDSSEKAELSHVLEEKENELSLARHLNEALKRELQEQEEKAEELKLRIIEEERSRSKQIIEDEKRRCESSFLIERRRIEEEEARRADKYIAEETERIKREQEEIYARREQDLIRQNYHDLITATPPAQPDAKEDNAASAPPVPPPPAPEEVPPEYYARDAVQEEPYSPPITEDDLPPATASDGIDFSEIERQAAMDGIRIATTGPKKKHGIQTESSVSLVHKGKCLFLSSIVACAFCIVLGSVLLGIRQTVAIPVFYPYVIWCVGIAVLLAMGLAYANHYGERAIRRNSVIILINVAVIYALCVIFTLIVALSARIDFSDAAAVATFIYVPIIFELTIPIFGVVYYFMVRARN